MQAYHQRTGTHVPYSSWNPEALKVLPCPTGHATHRHSYECTVPRHHVQLKRAVEGNQARAMDERRAGLQSDIRLDLWASLLSATSSQMVGAAQSAAGAAAGGITRLMRLVEPAPGGQLLGCAWQIQTMCSCVLVTQPNTI